MMTEFTKPQANNIVRRASILFILVPLLLFLVAACSAEDPVRIIITPTPPPSYTPGEQFIPTSIAQAQPIETTTRRMVAQAATQSTDTPTDSGTFGSVLGGASRIATSTIDPNFTPLPTVTPQPSNTPSPTSIPIATNTPGPTPVVTAMPNPTGLNRDAIGIQLAYNMTVEDWDRLMYYVRQIQPGWIKLQVDWSFMQPDFAGQFDQTFQLFEMNIERAKREGVRVMLSIAKAPDWARSNTLEDGPPDDPAQLAEFIRFLLYETKIGQNTDAIEIWNEPNLRREWQGTLPFSGDGYMRLFRPAYDAIMAYNNDPNTSNVIGVVTAGLAPTSTQPGAVDDRIFLQQMYDAGLGSYSNLAIGAHPFAWGNPPDHRCCDTLPERGWDDNPHFFFLSNLEDLRTVMTRNGHNSVNIWVTEFGWATWENFGNEPPEPWMRYNTPENQAEYTLRALQIGAELDYVGPMFIWNLNFAAPQLIEAQGEQAAYSILYPHPESGDLLFRPLYYRLIETLNTPNQ